MEQVQELVVSKLDAARRQLETAVLLYFYESDPVSIHTLTAAAYELLRGVDKASGGRGMMVKDLLLSLIQDDRVKEIRTKVNEAQNFFKHADQDADAVLKFRPLQTDMLLLDACTKYRDLTGEVVPLFGVFQAWFVLTWGKDFVRDTKAAEVHARLTQSHGGLTRSAFLAEVLPIMQVIKVTKQTDG